MEIGFVVLLIVVIILLIVVAVLLAKIKQVKSNVIQGERIYQQDELKIQQLQLENLESKLNPHLLKNILNSIQSHAYQTYFSMDKLGNVLDYILYESRNRFVSPKEELNFAMNLIEINKIKISPLFEQKVKLKIDEADPLFEQQLLAPLLTVDLIENAFKHADLQSGDAFVSFVFEFQDGIFSMTVSNKISQKTPLKKERGGLGNEALEKRLKIIYKDDFKLSRHAENGIYSSTLTINLLEYKAKMFATR